MWYSWSCRAEGWGLPTLGILATVSVWYHGDALYNGYGNYAEIFDQDVLLFGWWQTMGFAAVVLVASPLFHRHFNCRLAETQSVVSRLLSGSLSSEPIEQAFGPALKLAGGIWIVLSCIGLIRCGYDWQGMFFPWLGHGANPWVRSRVGSSSFDAIFSLAIYVNIFCLSTFGVAAAITNGRQRLVAIAFVLLAWPTIIFGRTRSTMLVIALPGFLSFVFLKMRGRFLVQAMLLVSCFLIAETWMQFVISARSTKHISRAFYEDGINTQSDARHRGLDMYSELCWLNSFIKEGSYEPNSGARYFAELVNPVPRSLWPGKPLIGIDYAIARGQGGNSEESAGVFATISTGMIGQGVSNFGTIFGPVAAALIMAVWSAVLARLDFQSQDPRRLGLYVLGMVLTFNLGRDITLIVIYPLLFGFVGIYLSEYAQRRSTLLDRTVWKLT